MEQNLKQEKCSEHTKCLELLQLVLDDEASEDEKSYYFCHLEKCMACYREYNLETEIRKVLRTKIDNRQVPADLVSSIKSKIRTTV
jgi:anti-sigma factor (TIGR02949 family)